MRIEIDNVVVVVEWVPFLRATESAPAEGGYFEVTQIEGHYNDDDLPDIEERAIVEAEGLLDQHLDNMTNR